jgi:hypothetical protein
MSNRTNLTLSALSNRLNLGTRSLVLNTSVNDGKQALRIRHIQHDHDVMRERMVWYVVQSFEPQKHDMPPIPDSIIPGQVQRPVRCQSQEPGRAACERALAEPAQAYLVVATGPGLAKPEPRTLPLSARPAGSAQRKRRARRSSRLAGSEAAATAEQAAPASAAAARAASAEV